MLFGKSAGSAGGPKPNVALAVVLVVVILAAGYMVFRTVMGAGGGSVPADTPSLPPGASVAPPTPRAPGEPVGPTAPGEIPPGPAPGGPQGAAPAPGGTPGAVPPPGPPMPGGAPSAPVAKPAVPTPQAKPSAAAPASPVKPPTSKPPAAQVPMRQIKVFQTVTISYPASWRISAGGGNLAAIFTDGKGVFEVHPPDVKATNAKEIALSALKSLAPGARVTAQGSGKIAGYETYWIAAKVGGDLARIAGVDGPTRIVLFEHVKGGSFASYRNVFDQMQEAITFSR